MSHWLPWPSRRDLQRVWNYVVDQTELTTEALLRMEKRLMSQIDDLVVRFAAATDEIASDLAALRDEVAGLDAGVAAKFAPLVSRLEALGADPANPVPDPEPTPDEPA